MYGGLDHDSVLRVPLAVSFIALGVAMFFRPDCFADLSPYFRCAAAKMAPFDRLRLTRAIAARESAEGIFKGYGRYLGIAGIVLAGLVFVSKVPLILPYLLLCLANAGVVLFTYAGFHQATQRRAAPLVRRSPLQAVSPLVVAAVICSLGVMLWTLLMFPHLRLGAGVVAISMVILAFVGWRVAGAPALLLGADPEFESAVDERLRTARANGAATLACIPAYLFLGLERVGVPDHNHTLFLGWWVLWAAVMVGMFVNITLARRPISVT